ncbi:protein kinase [Streptomyces zhihengii]|uniref:protein kinase domain-containing protein n=1 Tax=Streptomyces zhihengii TaxID=1818004 RepID=UPI003631EDFC
MELLTDSDRPEAGPYRLIAELGRGGMGRVLLGVAPDGRLAAVKVVRSQFVEDEGFRSRFRREVEASSRVSGACTAAVVDADADAPLPWLASVFVPGPALSTAVADTGPLPAGAAARLAAGLATALAQIHGAGLIHRDLKPSNVLLAADGPRVIDFGIARATDSEGGTEITHTGWLVGSPAYMSPEQAEGRELTPASDVFSLGTVLVHACTGRSPFAGTAAPQTLYNVVHTEPDLGPLPGALRGLVSRCLAKDPALRPGPAAILEAVGRIPPAVRPWPAAVHHLIDAQHADVLRVLGLREDESTLVTESGTLAVVRTPPEADTSRTAPPGSDTPVGGSFADLPTATAVPSERRPPEGASGTGAPGGADATGATAGTGGGAPAGGAGNPAGSDERAARNADAPGEAGVSGNPAGTPGERAARGAGVPGAGDGTLPGGRPSRRTLLLGALGVGGAAAAVAVPLVLDRGSKGSGRGASGAGSSSKSPSPSASASPSPSPSPSYERTSNALASAESGTMLSAGRFGKDGRFLAVGDRDGFVELRDSSTLEVLATLRNDASAAESGVGDLRFSPDGSLLAVVDDHAAVTLWDVASRKVAATLRGDSAQVETTVADCLAFSPDGRTLAYGADRTVVVWDVPSRRRIARMTDSADPEAEYKAEDYIGALAFGRDGRTLVHCNNLGKLRFWDLGRRRVTATVREPVDSITDLAVSPDGSLLAAATPEGVSILRTDTRRVTERLAFSSRTAFAVEFSPDGRRLAATEEGGRVQVWSTGGWEALATFERPSDTPDGYLRDAMANDTVPQGLSFDPRGDRLLETFDYHLVIWTLPR